MTFAQDMERFLKKVKGREATLYRKSVEHVFNSIVEGSAVTGAPGQPVDTSELINSFKLTVTGRRQAAIASQGVYHADLIEDNRRGATLRSKVGGFHSIKMTRIGWNNIVKHELKKLGNGSGDGNAFPRPKLTRARDARGRFTKRTGLTIDGK